MLPSSTIMIHCNYRSTTQRSVRKRCFNKLTRSAAGSLSVPRTLSRATSVSTLPMLPTCSTCTPPSKHPMVSQTLTLVTMARLGKRRVSHVTTFVAIHVVSRARNRIMGNFRARKLPWMSIQKVIILHCRILNQPSTFVYVYECGIPKISWRKLSQVAFKP